MSLSSSLSLLTSTSSNDDQSIETSSTNTVTQCSGKCLNERKTYCKDLHRWGRNLLYMIGLECVAKRVTDKRKWAHISPFIDEKNKGRKLSEVCEKEQDWQPDEKCTFCTIKESGTCETEPDFALTSSTNLDDEPDFSTITHKNSNPLHSKMAQNGTSHSKSTDQSAQSSSNSSKQLNFDFLFNPPAQPSATQLDPQSLQANLLAAQQNSFYGAMNNPYAALMGYGANAQYQQMLMWSAMMNMNGASQLFGNMADASALLAGQSPFSSTTETTSAVESSQKTGTTPKLGVNLLTAPKSNSNSKRSSPKPTKPSATTSSPVKFSAKPTKTIGKTAPKANSVVPEDPLQPIKIEKKLPIFNIDAPLDLSVKNFKSEPTSFSTLSAIDSVLKNEADPTFPTDLSLPSNGVVVTNNGKRTYTQADLENAVKDIRAGKLGTRRASVVYGIPRSTLRNKIYKLEASEDPNGDKTTISPTPSKRSRSGKASAQSTSAYANGENRPSTIVAVADVTNQSASSPSSFDGLSSLLDSPDSNNHFQISNLMLGEDSNCGLDFSLRQSRPNSDPEHQMMNGDVDNDDRKRDSNESNATTPDAGKPRPKRGQYRKYDKEALDKAVLAVRQGEMSVHRAGSHFGVPHSTLEYKVKERNLLRSRGGKKPNSRSAMGGAFGEEDSWMEEGSSARHSPMHSLDLSVASVIEQAQRSHAAASRQSESTEANGEPSAATNTPAFDLASLFSNVQRSDKGGSEHLTEQQQQQMNIWSQLASVAALAGNVLGETENNSDMATESV